MKKIVTFTKEQIDAFRTEITGHNKMDTQKMLIGRTMREAHAQANFEPVCTSFKLHENGSVDVIMHQDWNDY